MNNYQLYRTNVLLGGQMKYDLILNSTGDNNNIIDDIHISPISDRIPYNKYIKEDILNYSHQENIKKFYKNISGSFYKDFINPLFDNSYPLPDDYKGDNYESTYEMGCRRKNYQLYGKQFEFFCPVWIEQISKLNQLKFEIQIKTAPDNISQTYKQPLSITKIIKFSKDGEISKLEKYFNDYIKFIKLDNGRDWVFDINKTCSVVSGLNVETGINVDKELNSFYRDLIYRERPLLEFNNIIINELNKNNLITPQLFNFNICFNLEDLLSEFVMEQLYCQPIYININILIDDKPLQYVDIFSNHEYIKKKVLSSSSYPQKITRENILERFIDYDDNLNEFNVLDYLKDNKCIDLIDKNKMLQNVCHWCTNKSFYHFNVYDGFGMLFKNENEYTEIPYYSEHVADIKNSKIINEIYQYPYWCNSYSLTKDHLKELIPEILNQYYDHDYLFSTFTSNCEVKNINYKTSKNIKPIDVMILEIEENEENDEWGWGNISQNFLKVYGGKDWVYLEIKNDNDFYKILYNEIIRKIILFSQPNQAYIEKLMYKNILSILSNASIPLLLELSDILSNPNQNPFNDLIKFTNGLVCNKADSPSISSQEIEYYKAKSNKSLVRMMGKIKPYFIYSRDIYKNYQYYKLKYNETSSEYKIYTQSIYEPKYPSLNYTSLNYKDIKYEYKYDDNDLENSLIEYHHYMTNKIIYLLPYIDYEAEIIENSNLYVEDLIKECIEKNYNILFETSDEDHKNKKLSYIVNKYELIKSYIETDGDKPIYKIQIRLK